MVSAKMTSKKQYVNKKIKDSVEPETMQWVENRFLPFLKRQGLSTGTESNRLQALSKLLLIENLQPQNWQKEDVDIKTLGEKVAGNIQADHYVEQGNGGMSKRRKRMIWTCFKNMVELEGFNTDKLPNFTPKETGEVNHRAKDTDPENIPSPEQVKKFVRDIGKYSSDIHKLRNQSLILLMWDKGPRIGEALNIQLKDVEIKNDKLEIFIEGNKQHTEDRTVQIYQGRETLKEFYNTHPGEDEDYLFSDLMHRNLGKPVGRQKIGQKIKQVAAAENHSFTVNGQPNHIFRKGMTTSHIVNEWATWEEVCKLQGKTADGTKPTYLKMALNDVNQSVGQKIGAVNENNNPDFHMLGNPLLPQKCVACEKVNKCFAETCEYCSGDLETPTRSAFQKTEEELDEEIREELRNQIRKYTELAEKAGVDLDGIKD